MANKTSQKIIRVYAHWAGMQKPEIVGSLQATPSRGKEIFSFEYDTHWLQHPVAHALDPSLQLLSGKQYPSASQDSFGIFMDSSPDRWGRLLMKRREALLAREGKRKERTLLESDYLLGVYDEQRMGALRFSLDGPFLDNNKTYTAPPWTSLRKLEQASLKLETENSEKDPAYSQWLNMLIAPGGSLGGARPKAGVIDEKNHLWIAKFPSAHDEYNIGAWEMVVFNLAKNAGVTVSEAKAEIFNKRHHTFINKRFDRNKAGERLHFASAMTLLQRMDGDDYTKGASYLELVDFIIQQGASPNQDLEQLWRRIVFNICVSNVDDHLRNHGFLLKPLNGWVLSPAFDMNPVADGDGLKLNISESDNSQNLELAKEVAAYFRLSPQRADEIIKEVITSTKNWRKEAKKLSISENEQDRLLNAFRITEQFKS